MDVRVGLQHFVHKKLVPFQLGTLAIDLDHTNDIKCTFTFDIISHNPTYNEVARESHRVIGNGFNQQTLASFDSAIFLIDFQAHPSSSHACWHPKIP